MWFNPIWTGLHLGDQGRHGTSHVYQLWSDKYGNYDCVKGPPRTQGIVEFHQKSTKHIVVNSQGIVDFHQKSTKHIVMNSNRERIDEVVQNLFAAKKSKFRQLEIIGSRKRRFHPTTGLKLKTL